MTNQEMLRIAMEQSAIDLGAAASDFEREGHTLVLSRPEAIDKACFVLSGIDEKGLLQAVDTAVAMNEIGDFGIPVPDYVEENVSTKVVKIIQSYTGVVDKMVWRKA